MLLHNLPNDLLVMLIESLLPQERFKLRKTCKRLRSLVDDQCFPLDFNRFAIDFVHQVIIMDYLSPEFCLAIVNNSIRYSTNAQSPLLSVKFQGFCMVGDDWNTHLRRYIRRMNKMSKRTFLINFLLPVNRVPEEIFMLNVRFERLIIQVDNKQIHTYDPLPEALDSWISEARPKIESLLVYFALSPEQLDRIATKNCMCLLKDEGAMHIIEKFSSQSLPPNFGHFQFIVDRTSSVFLQTMRSRYGLRPIGIPFLHNEFVVCSGGVRLEIKPYLRGNGIFMILTNK